MNLSGAYIHSSSPLHKMDAFVRIVSFIILFASIIVSSATLWGYLFSVAVISVLFRIGRVSLRPVLRTLVGFKVFFITVFLMNALFQRSDEAYFSWWIITFSRYGMMMGIRMVMSVALLTMLSSLLTATATPIAVTDGLRALLQPLSYLRFPVDEISFIISMSIALIPVLSTESSEILLSVRARGAEAGGKSARDRAVSLIPFTVPLFLGAFRKADEIATAMEARGYSGKHARRHVRIGFTGREAIALLVSLTILAISILIKGGSK